MRVTRDRSGLIVGIGFGVILNLASLVMLVLVLHRKPTQIRNAKERRTSEQLRGGPVIVMGPATRASLLRSPAGVEGIAWAGRVGRMEKRAKTTEFVEYCKLSYVNGLTVSGTKVSLYDGAEIRRAPERSLETVIDLGIDEAQPLSIPREVRENPFCSTFPTDAYYQEVVVAPGTPLTVSGCIHGKSSDVIEPCQDGADYVSIVPPATMLERLRHDLGKRFLLSILFALCGLPILLFVAARTRTLVSRKSW